MLLWDKSVMLTTRFKIPFISKKPQYKAKKADKLFNITTKKDFSMSF